jgi:CheY-like chemotaxis protein
MDSDIHALIIDDSSTDQVVLARLLSLENVQITQIYDPLRLEAHLPNFDEIDIIFLDLEMPNLNGYQVLQILKEFFGDHVPIVACTVHTSEVNTAKELGFHSFIGKPLNGDRFPLYLQRILDGQSVWEA